MREAVGGGMFDYQFDEPWLVVDARILPESRMPDRNLQLCDPDRPTTCVMSGPGRHRWEFMLLPHESPAEMADDASIQRLIAPWECGPVEIERKAVYRFHGLVANRWRDRRVLIAGDAAHQTPPFAGQGMCAGLRDAVNLAWKLEAALAGQAEDALLDTYQAEREPHARGVIELAIGMGRIVCMTDREAAKARDARMLALREAGGTPLPPPGAAPFASACVMAGTPGAGAPFPQPSVTEGASKVRMDDRLGLGGWLITRSAPSAPAEGVMVFGLQDRSLAPFRVSIESWLDERGVDAVLIRPDRCIFGSGEAEALLAAWSAALKPMPLAA